jgi:hypothetical protein
LEKQLFEETSGLSLEDELGDAEGEWPGEIILDKALGLPVGDELSAKVRA